MKIQLNIYYNEDIKNSSEQLIYYYTLFLNDCPDEFEFGTKMIETYIQQNILEIESKTKKKSVNVNKKKKRVERAQPESWGYSVDHSKHDPMEEEFFRKNKISRNEKKSNLF